MALIAIGLFVGGLALSQEPIAKPPMPLPDPTKPSKTFEGLLQPKSGPGQGPRFPTIALKGRVIMQGKPAAALLEIDKGLVLVNQGSAVGGGGMLIRVIDVNAQEVLLEVGPTAEKLSLR
jgi:hypothetical protein